MTGTAESGPSSAEGRPRWDQVTNGWRLGYLDEVAGSRMRSGERSQFPAPHYTAAPLRGPDRGEETPVRHTNHRAGREYLVGSHCERENVALLRRVAVFKTERPRIQQLWGHIMDDSWLGCCRTISFHDSRVCDNRCDPKVSEARAAFLGNQDVSLGESRIERLANACLR